MSRGQPSVAVATSGSWIALIDRTCARTHNDTNNRLVKRLGSAMNDESSNDQGLCFEETFEQRSFRDEVRKFVDKEIPKNYVRDLEASKEFPWELHRKLADHGMFGIGIGEKYGGQGGNFHNQVIVADELARSLAGLCVIWSVNAWSAARAIIDHGTEAQKEEYLPSMAAGETLFAFSMTEPGVKATPIPKLGARSVGSCEVIYEDVFVPDSQIIGKVGEGWSQLVGTLAAERIQVAAHSVGILRAVLEDSIDYAKQRETFGKPIGQHQTIQTKIADMAINLETAILHTYRAAWLFMNNRRCHVEATMAKYLASEYATKAADDGIQILGGYGYSDEFNMHRYWRDVRLYRIGPISNEMALNVIGESLGLPRSY